jgi:DNA polymerase-4
MKTRDFKSRTRSRQLAAPTQLADRIYRLGNELLINEVDGTKFRLIGIGVSDLHPAELADPEDLIAQGDEKRAAAERAMDKIKDRFGGDKVALGHIWKPEAKTKNNRDGPGE